ncbi:MAG: WYL domain-containing protein [Desulfobulbus sp.]|nr:WYL domain-containing protein [Desulfobulbus sp.]
MAQIDRIHELLSIFYARRYPIKFNDLLALVDYSEPTLKRYIRKLREHGAPLRYDFPTQGYILDTSDDDAFQLPGLWFNVSELHSLLTIHELIDQLDPDLLKLELLPLRQRIEQRLSARGIKTGELSRRIQLVGVGIRLCCPLAFRTTATALIERKRLKLSYHSRSEDKISTRQVSPQRLLYYRGNWYLAAYCHTRRALRILALERMSEIVPQEGECLEIDEEQLRDFCTGSFGIFAGSPKQEAVLVFTKESARWVAEERWHPNQQNRWLADGTFELRLPYADQRELVMEILRYGPDVRVIAPPELQQAVRERLRSALVQYEEKMQIEKK